MNRKESMYIFITRQYKIFITAALLLFAAIGCSPDACYEDTESAVRASFFITGTGNNVAPDSLWIRGLGDEYPMLYSNARGLKEVSLPLNPATTSVSFSIRINETTDTITFSYSSFPRLISMECGYSFFHTISASFSTSNRIDTIIIRNPSITTAYEENIRIFY